MSSARHMGCRGYNSCISYFAQLSPCLQRAIWAAGFATAGQQQQLDFLLLLSCRYASSTRTWGAGVAVIEQQRQLDFLLIFNCRHVYSATHGVQGLQQLHFLFYSAVAMSSARHMGCRSCNNWTTTTTTTGFPADAQLSVWGAGVTATPSDFSL